MQEHCLHFCPLQDVWSHNLSTKMNEDWASWRYAQYFAVIGTSPLFMLLARWRRAIFQPVIQHSFVRARGMLGLIAIIEACASGLQNASFCSMAVVCISNSGLWQQWSFVFDEGMLSAPLWLSLGSFVLPRTFRTVPLIATVAGPYLALNNKVQFVHW